MKKNILIVLLSSLFLLICGCEAKEDYVENTEIEETTCTVSVKEETINDSSPLNIKQMKTKQIMILIQIMMLI